ncbi:MAG TPA: hypothetical protein VG943_04765 [Caulobacterales bacterium]|nr:hypothetical protein [Caulobacterales bacterium]
MKLKQILGAALAALTLGAALPAAAQGYDRHGDNYGRHDGGGGAIYIEGRYSAFAVTPRDRIYRTVVRDYHFRPGYTYHYTDRCNRAGCDVLVFDGRGGRPIDRVFAPRPGYGHDWRVVGRNVPHDFADRDRYRDWRHG